MSDVTGIILAACAALLGFMVYRTGKEQGENEATEEHLEEVEELGEEIADAHLAEKRAKTIVGRVLAALARARKRRRGTTE